MTLLPGGRRARAREVQVHNAVADRAQAGQRVAVNLSGVSTDQVQRGDVLTGSGSGLRETFVLDAELAFSGQEPEHGDRVQIHHGTRESPARLTWLGGRFWQVRLEAPLIAVAGDRMVIRQIAPPDTLGGGRVLDAHPRKHGPSRDLLVALERLVAGRGRGRARGARAGSGREVAAEPAPLRPSAQALEARLHAAGFEPPLDTDCDAEDLAALRTAGRAVRVTRTLHFHPDRLAEIRAIVIATAQRHEGAITIAQLRDELGTSRKFAQALLEHFDTERVTIRRGDAHYLRRAAARTPP